MLITLNGYCRLLFVENHRRCRFAQLASFKLELAFEERAQSYYYDDAYYYKELTKKSYNVQYTLIMKLTGPLVQDSWIARGIVASERYPHDS